MSDVVPYIYFIKVYTYYRVHGHNTNELFLLNKIENSCLQLFAYLG